MTVVPMPAVAGLVGVAEGDRVLKGRQIKAILPGWTSYFPVSAIAKSSSIAVALNIGC